MLYYYVECKECNGLIEVLRKPTLLAWAQYMKCPKCRSIQIYTHSDINQTASTNEA